MRHTFRVFVILTIWAICLTVMSSLAVFAAGADKEQQLAQYRKELEQVKKDLKKIQLKKQEQIQAMTVDSKKHVANTMLNMYRAAKKYKVMEKEYEKEETALETKWDDEKWTPKYFKSEEYKALQEKYIEKYEEFTGVKTGKSSFYSVYRETIEILKKGRGVNLDELELEERWLIRLYGSVNGRIKRLESGVSQSTTDEDLPTSGRLELRVSQTQFEVAVGEIKLVSLTVCGGKPPYQFTITSLSGENGRERTLQGPARLNEPFSFTFPGMPSLYLTLKDSSFPSQETSLTLVFRVIGEEPEEEEPGQPEEEEPDDSKKEKPKETPIEKKPGKKTTPIKPLIGTYRADFWIPIVERPGMGFVKMEYARAPVPIVLSFSADGRVTGDVDYDCPENRFDENNKMHWTRMSWNTKFRVQGSVNWQTGRMEIKIIDGHIESRHERRGGDTPYQAGWDIDYDAKLIGYYVPGPQYEKVLTEVPDSVKEQGATPSDWINKGIPTIVAGPDGKFRFKDRGWWGNPLIQTESTGRVNLKRYIKFNIYLKKEVEDVTDQWNKRVCEPTNKSGVHWFLKILGPAPEVEPEEMDGELCGFAVWPESPVRLTVGQAEQFQAMGVFLENVFDAVDLSGKVKWEVLELKNVGGKATWQKSKALKKMRTGKYEATRPGTYYVRAWTRNKGDLFSDAIEVKVEAPSKKTINK